MSNEIVIAPQPGKQELAMQVKADVLIYGGARGAGKSRLLLMKPLLHAHDDPNFHGIFLRRETGQLRGAGGLWPEGIKLYSPFKPKIRDKDMQWKFPVGSTISCKHLEHEKDKESHRGLQYSFIGFDEIDAFSETMFTFMLASLRSEARVDSYCIGTCNPNPDSWLISWIEWYLDGEGFPREDRCGVVRYFVVIDDKPVFCDTEEEIKEKYPASVYVTHPTTKEQIYVRPKTFCFINGTVFDNPALIEHSPGYLSELQNLPEVERARQLHGNWYVRPQGSSYFQREWLHKSDKIPTNAKSVRGWDKAYSEVSEKNRYPDYSACIKMYKTSEGYYYITGEFHNSIKDDAIDVYGRFRKRPGQRNTLIINQAKYDGEDCTVVIPLDPGAGRSEYEEMAKMLTSEGFKVSAAKTEKNKLARFASFSSAAQNGLVYIVENTFPNVATLEAFYKELESFTGERSTTTRKDDWADATGDVFTFLCKERVVITPSIPQISSPTLAHTRL